VPSKELPSRLRAIDVWHVDVHQDEVGFEGGDLPKGFLRRRGFSNQSKTICRCKQALRRCAGHHAIVYDQHP